MICLMMMMMMMTRRGVLVNARLLVIASAAGMV